MIPEIFFKIKNRLKHKMSHLIHFMYDDIVFPGGILIDFLCKFI